MFWGITHFLNNSANGRSWVRVSPENKETGTEPTEARVEVGETLEKEADAVDAGPSRTNGEGRGIRMEVKGVDYKYGKEVVGSPACVVQGGVVVDPQPLPEPEHGVGLHDQTTRERGNGVRRGLFARLKWSDAIGRLFILRGRGAGNGNKGFHRGHVEISLQ